MTNAQHTGGKLDYIGDEDGDFVLFLKEEYAANIGSERIAHVGMPPGTVAFDMDKQFAERMKACWNACEGLSNEEVEKIGELRAAAAELIVAYDNDKLDIRNVAKAFDRLNAALNVPLPAIKGPDNER